VSFTVFGFSNRNTVGYASPGPIYTTLLENVTVTYLARRNPFHSVHKDANLYEVAEILSRGLHRVPVVDSEGKLVSIISQSNIISLLNQHLGELEADTLAPIQDIPLGTSPVLTVSFETSTIDTFKLMDDHKKNSLAIVDKHGILVANISGKDLKLFIENSSPYEVLSLPILDFLSRIRSAATDIVAPSII